MKESASTVWSGLIWVRRRKLINTLRMVQTLGAGTSEWPTLMSPDQVGVFVGSGPK